MLKHSVVLVTFCTVFAFGLVRPAVTQNANNLFVADATASSTQESSRQPTDVLDNNDSTRWNAYGKDQYLELNTGGIAAVNAVKIKWYNGAQRTATFHVDVSTDGIKWTRVLTNQNSQRTANLERYLFKSQPTRYIRIVNRGNSTGNDVIAIIQAVVEGIPINKTYYIDCLQGNDDEKVNSGTTPDRAWKSISKVNGKNFNAGDSILLKRGCTFTGPLNAKWIGSAIAPITIGAYGEGDDDSNPPKVSRTGEGEVIRIQGQYQIIEHLKAIAPVFNSTKTGRCPSQPLGWSAGFGIYGDKEMNTDNDLNNDKGVYNIVRHNSASGFTAGVHFGKFSHHNKALHNILTSNNVMSVNTPREQQYDDDSGAWGILLNSDYNEVAYNYFEGNVACSEDYDVEGASIEVSAASNNNIHHNISIRESTFTELGGQMRDGKEVNARYNRYAYNVYSAKGFTSPYIKDNSNIPKSRLELGGEFLVVRGEKSKWGGNPGTKFQHNTGYWLNVGISCTEGCNSNILEAHNNILWASNPTDSPKQKSLVFSDGTFTQSKNIFWRDDKKPDIKYNYQKSPSGQETWDSLPSSIKDDPKFVDATNANFRLQATSPAINAAEEVDLSWANPLQDVYGNAAPKPKQDSARDIGAAEY